MISGFLLIGLGMVYVAKPDLFQRGLWRRTAISQQVLSPKHNMVYMRILGGVLILSGVVVLQVGSR